MNVSNVISGYFFCFSFSAAWQTWMWILSFTGTLLDGVEMYAFYSLLVYIFYTVFKKEEEEEEASEGACGASSDVCLASSCLASWGSSVRKPFFFLKEHAWVTYFDSIKRKLIGSLTKVVHIGSIIACNYVHFLSIHCVNIMCKSDPHIWWCTQEPGPVSMGTGSRRRDGHTPKMGKKAGARLSESSECELFKGQQIGRCMI